MCWGIGCLDGAGQVDLGFRGRCLAIPERVAVGLDVVVRAAGLDALRVVLGVPAVLRGLVALVDEQPLVAFVVLERLARRAAGPATGPDDRESTLELLAVEPELELAVGDGGRGVDRGSLGLPGPPVPDDDVARAVLLGRDDALEVEVLDRVVLDVDGHPPDLGVEGGALRDGPAHEDAADLEPEVVVEPRGAMTLDDEAAAAPADLGVRRAGGRFGRLGEVALAAVFLEGHQRECARPMAGLHEMIRPGGRRPRSVPTVSAAGAATDRR